MEKLKIKKTLWETLKEDFKFKPHVITEPLNGLAKIRKFFSLPYKTKQRSSDDWLSADINGNHYDVINNDIWYVDLLKNDVQIFTGRRFADEDFLNLII